VCSTTLPQQVLPTVMSDVRYYPMLEERTKRYAARAEKAHTLFSEIPEVLIHKPNGAFYMTLVFREGVLTPTQTLEINNTQVKEMVEKLVRGDITHDKRFVYYLLGATGVCVVPLTSGFNSSYNGFRFTLLEPDDRVFERTLTTVCGAIRTYIAS
jgi:aspartate/methionine/tyrosine aminotransferase